MAYRHGVYVNEMESSQVAPASATAGLQVVVGTAPVHLLEDPEAAVNTPLLVQSLTEATQAVGYSADWVKYTICDAVNASFTMMGVGPLVLINVLDPKKHTTEMPETQVTVKDGQATVEREGLLLAGLTVKNGGTALTEGEDYLAGRDSDGNVVLTMIAGGKGESAEALTVSGKILDAGKVTARRHCGRPGHVHGQGDRHGSGAAGAPQAGHEPRTADRPPVEHGAHGGGGLAGQDRVSEQRVPLPVHRGPG